MLLFFLLTRVGDIFVAHFVIVVVAVVVAAAAVIVAVAAVVVVAAADVDDDVENYSFIQWRLVAVVVEAFIRQISILF